MAVKLEVVLPSAIDILLLVHDNIISNLLKSKETDIDLPNTYERAFMVVNETHALITGKINE